MPGSASEAEDTLHKA